MNPFLFCGFDITTGMRFLQANPSTNVNTIYTEFMWPSGVYPYVKKYYDSIGTSENEIRLYTHSIQPGRNNESYSLGGSGNISVPGNYWTLGGSSFLGGPALYFNKSGYGVTDEIYYTCDLFLGTGGGISTVTTNIFTDAPYEGGISIGYYGRYTGTSILQFGPIVIRYMGYSGYNGTSADVTFGVFNSERFVARLDVLGNNMHDFGFLKAHILLNTGSGVVDLAYNGTSLRYAANTLSGNNTINHRDAQDVVFGPSALVRVTNGIHAYNRMDNCYFSKQGYPAGRPRGERLFLGSSRNNAGWLNFNSESLVSGVAPSGTGYISGALNSSVEFVAAIPSYTSGDNLIAFNYGLLGLNNNDLMTGRRIAASPVVLGEQYLPIESGSNISNALFRTFIGAQRLITNPEHRQSGLLNTAIKLEVI